MRRPRGSEGEPLPKFDPDNMEKWMGPYVAAEDNGTYSPDVVTPVVHVVYDLFRDTEILSDGTSVVPPVLGYQALEVDRFPEGTSMVIARAASSKALETAKLGVQESGIHSRPNQEPIQATEQPSGSV